MMREAAALPGEGRDGSNQSVYVDLIDIKNLIDSEFAQ